MKKFFISLMFIITSVMSINAQSFQVHQSFDDNKSTWGSVRFISDYFWTSENGDWNVFSWNSFSKNGISGLIYGEYVINHSNFLVHTEIRTQFGNFDYNTITPELGFAYLMNVCGASVYVTPKYVYNDVYFSKHDFEVSFNSCYEDDNVYYEGYLDTNWIKGASLFTEQKAYYKVNNNIQFGACVVGNAGKMYGDNGSSHIQPYLSVRISLY